MRFLEKEKFSINVGFPVTITNVLNTVKQTNDFLKNLPENLFKSIDFKTTGSIIGAIFCDKLAQSIPNASVNPIEKGHPDIIPSIGLGSTEKLLRNYPQGLEVKGTIGKIRTGANLRAGKRRIDELNGIIWQAHHREVNKLMGFLWDFNSEHNGFLFPMIVGVFYTDELCQDDWSQVSGTTGRNTKVSSMMKSGKEKMGNGWVILLNEEKYLLKLKKYLFIKNITE
jgi:hypothetical protein